MGLPPRVGRIEFFHYPGEDSGIHPTISIVELRDYNAKDTLQPSL
jgi:hypothetical protein